MKITKEWLRKHHACEEGISWFAKVFPKGFNTLNYRFYIENKKKKKNISFEIKRKSKNLTYWECERCIRAWICDCIVILSEGFKSFNTQNMRGLYPKSKFSKALNSYIVGDTFSYDSLWENLMYKLTDERRLLALHYIAEWRLKN